MTLWVSPEVIREENERKAFANEIIGAYNTYCKVHQLDCERFAWNAKARAERDDGKQSRSSRRYLQPPGY